jgi:hypothetical protein
MHSRIFLAASLLTVPTSASAQRSAWLTRLGQDTTTLERAERKGNHIAGRQVQTAPYVRTVDFTLDLNKAGGVSHYHMISYDTAGTTQERPRATLDVSFAPNDIVAILTRAGKPDTTHVPAGPIPIPYLYNNWTLMEQLTREMARAGTDSLSFAWYNAGEKQLQPAVARWVGRDSISVDFSPAVLMLRADRGDKAGKLIGADGRRTTIKVVPERMADLDVDGFARKFLATQRAAAERSRLLSPRDTARATIAGASLLVDYGRPARRGRVVWGGLVPYGVVWRTGANAATQFTTDRTLEFAGGAKVPPGTYTLWTIPAADGATLVINRQVQQWGTEYDQAQDLVRVSVKFGEQPGEALERFTISIEPQEAGGVIYMAWDTRRVAATFQVL